MSHLDEIKRDESESAENVSTVEEAQENKLSPGAEKSLVNTAKHFLGHVKEENMDSAVEYVTKLLVDESVRGSLVMGKFKGEVSKMEISDFSKIAEIAIEEVEKEKEDIKHDELKGDQEKEDAAEIKRVRTEVLADSYKKMADYSSSTAKLQQDAGSRHYYNKKLETQRKTQAVVAEENRLADEEATKKAEKKWWKFGR